MPQLVTRLSDALVAEVDRLVELGQVTSRSDAVRVALERLVDEHHRADLAQRILDGYKAIPETDDEPW